MEIAREHFPGVECKWGDKGFDEIVQDESILGVAVVLAGQTQVRSLCSWKHSFNLSIHIHFFVTCLIKVCLIWGYICCVCSFGCSVILDFDNFDICPLGYML